MALRKNPPHARSFSNSPHRQYVSSGAEVSVVMLGSLAHRVESRLHRLLESFVDLALRPEERILILHPLIVTHRYPTCVCKNIGQKQNSFILQHSIGPRRGWTI